MVFSVYFIFHITFLIFNHFTSSLFTFLPFIPLDCSSSSSLVGWLVGKLHFTWGIHPRCLPKLATTDVFHIFEYAPAFSISLNVSISATTKSGTLPQSRPVFIILFVQHRQWATHRCQLKLWLCCFAFCFASKKSEVRAGYIKCRSRGHFSFIVLSLVFYFTFPFASFICLRLAWISLGDIFLVLAFSVSFC